MTLCFVFSNASPNFLRKDEDSMLYRLPQSKLSAVAVQIILYLLFTVLSHSPLKVCKSQYNTIKV